MKKTIVAILFSLVLVVSPLAAEAPPKPPIAGLVSGIELCPQFICTVAIFAGTFRGQIGIIPNATGIVATAVTHGELPTVEGGTTPIYGGGVWELKTLLRRFSGDVDGGCIQYLGSNKFEVTIFLTLRSGGSGNLTFSGTLDHNPTIPIFYGSLN